MAADEPSGHLDAVFGIDEKAGEVLLVRNPRHAAGQIVSAWDLPGGRLEAGESLTQALQREWREETGLEATIGELCLVVDGRKLRGAAHRLVYTWRAFFFRVQSEGRAAAGEGIDTVVRVPRDEAVARLDLPYHAPIRAWFAGDPARHAEVIWQDDAQAEPPALTRTMAMARLAAVAALGDAAAVRDATPLVQAAGVGAAQIEELLLQLVPYAGFPRTLSAFAAAREGMRASGASDSDEAPLSDEVDADTLAARGRAAFETVYGDSAERVEAGLRELHPLLSPWTLQFAYGRVKGRPGLSMLERERLAVAILTALGDLERPLLGHMRAAVRLGATVGELAQCLDGLAGYVPPRRLAAARALLPRV